MMGIFGQIRSVNPFGGGKDEEKKRFHVISLFPAFFFDKDVSIFSSWASQMKRCLLKEVNLWGHPHSPKPKKMCCRTPTPIPRTTKGKKKNQTNWRSMQSSCSSSVRYISSSAADARKGGAIHHFRKAAAGSSGGVGGLGMRFKIMFFVMSLISQLRREYSFN